jgi:predicted dienelactone hydrolase
VRLVNLVGFFCAGCLTALLPADDRPAAYKLEAGPLDVRSVETLVLQDAARGKDLQVRINYPDGPGPFPVIVFSHGAFGMKEAYQPLTSHWTSHGYVTIQPDHSDSRSLGVRPGDPAAFRDWQSRPADVTFLIDSLDAIEAQVPDLKDKLDKDRIGVGGHSFGANTAQLIGGAKARTPSGEKSFADARVKAVLLMSGQGIGEMLTKDSWKEFQTPMLVMSGSADGPTRTGQPAVWRKEPYELCPPGDKYLVWIEGLDHGYGGITGVRSNRQLKTSDDHIAWTRAATTAFWDAYLKREAVAIEYLKSYRLSAYTKGALTLSSK